MKNLGWLNGWWANPPQEVVKCEAAKHIREEVNNGRSCTTVVICHTCGYTYKIDSSG